MSPILNDVKRSLLTIDDSETSASPTAAPIPLIVRNTNDDITSISCEDGFTTTTMYVNEDLTYDYTDPRLFDIVIDFAYDVHIKKDIIDETVALQQLKNKLYVSILNQFPIVGTDEADILSCDTLMDNSMTSMFTSLGYINRKQRNLRRLEDESWDYYLGWKNEPNDKMPSTEKPCAQSSLSSVDGTDDSTICKPITSSFTAQVPSGRADITKQNINEQILKHVKDGFANNEFVIEDSIPHMNFIGIRDIFSGEATDVLTVDQQHKELDLDADPKVFTAFGVSATSLLGAAVVFTFGLFGYKIKTSRTRNGPHMEALSDENDRFVDGQNAELEKDSDDDDKDDKERTVYAHPSNDGVEIVHVGNANGDGLVNGKFVDALSREMSKRDGITTGFDGMSLSGWMESLRNGTAECVDASSCGGSSTLDKVELNEEEENDLLGIEDSSLETSDSDDDNDESTTGTNTIASSTVKLQAPISPSRMRSTLSRIF